MRFAVATSMLSLSTLRDRFIKRAAAIILPWGLLLGPTGLRAQTSTKLTKPPPQAKDDVKGAEKAADRGDKAAAAGRMDEALGDYDAAVRMAPGDIGIRRRAAGVRAQVVQKIVDQAEAKAVDGRIGDAVDLLYKALQIDPGNTILSQRIAEMRQMPPQYIPRGDREDYALKGPATLNP